MLRTILGFAALAVVGFFVIKLVFSLVGMAISVAVSILWLAALGFVFYLILKVINPEAARRIREVFTGRPAV